MYNHEPKNYVCPFCRDVQRTQISLDGTDIFFHDAEVNAFLGLGRWKNNPVDVLIVTTRHIENIYDLPLELAPAIQRVTREVAIGLKALTRCEGVSTWQHNEPAGGSGCLAFSRPHHAPVRGRSLL